MDRKQIAKAHALFSELDRQSHLLEAARSGKGLAVGVNGSFQPEGVLEAVREPLVGHFGSEVRKIKAELKQLGWSGQ